MIYRDFNRCQGSNKEGFQYRNKINNSGYRYNDSYNDRRYCHLHRNCKIGKPALNEIQVTKPDGTTEDFVGKFPRYS